MHQVEPDVQNQAVADDHRIAEWYHMDSHMPDNGKVADVTVPMHDLHVSPVHRPREPMSLRAYKVPPATCTDS